MSDVVIQEEYILPSKGLVYNKPFDPHVKLRSMTVAEEMKRLAPSDNPYKTMSEIIEDCLLTKLPVHVYDLCLGDYIFLLHKLRTVTYGPEYTLRYICPVCGNVDEITVNLDDLDITEYDENLKKLMTINLPVTKKTLNLRLQTPKDLDKIDHKSKEMKKEFPEMVGDPAILLTLESLIESVDGETINPVTIGETLKKLPQMDASVIVQSATKLQNSVGVSNIIKSHCEKCGRDIDIPFRYTSEFFGPKVI